MTEANDTRTIDFTLSTGEPGTASRFVGDLLTIATPRPFPPGSPVAFTMALGEEASAALRGKALGSKKREDGLFVARVRMISLRRAQRQALRDGLPE